MFKKILILIFIFTLINIYTLTISGEKKDDRISQMAVSIWPEYDDPRVLVIYEGHLVQGVSSPATLKFLVPKGIDINMAGEVTTDGKHIHQPFELKPSGEFAELIFKVNGSTFWMEFYYDPVKGKIERDFLYRIKSGLSVDKMKVEVQEPFRSSNFSVNPTPLSVDTDNRGFKYSRYEFSNLKPERELNLRIKYTKADFKPSVIRQDSSQKQTQEAGGLNPGMLTVFVVTTFAIILILSAYWVISGKKRQGEKVIQTSHINTQAGKQRFCTQCGTGISIDFSFCPGCGKKLK